MMPSGGENGRIKRKYNIYSHVRMGRTQRRRQPSEQHLDSPPHSISDSHSSTRIGSSTVGQREGSR